MKLKGRLARALHEYLVPSEEGVLRGRHTEDAGGPGGEGHEGTHAVTSAEAGDAIDATRHPVVRAIDVARPDETHVEVEDLVAGKIPFDAVCGIAIVADEPGEPVVEG